METIGKTIDDFMTGINLNEKNSTAADSIRRSARSLKNDVTEKRETETTMVKPKQSNNETL